MKENKDSKQAGSTEKLGDSKKWLYCKEKDAMWLYLIGHITLAVRNKSSFHHHISQGISLQLQ